MPCERVQDQNLAFRPLLIRRRFDELCAIGLDSDQAHQEILALCERDLTYYFLEQFAKKRLVSYSYHFETDEQGQKQMVSAHYERFGDVCDLFANAVSERRERGQGFDREEAELSGFLKVKQNLIESTEPTSLILVSPPPPSSDYSFIYFGLFDPKIQKIEMYAWRNNLSLDSQRLIVNEYAEKKIISPEAHPNDFLRSPIFKTGQAALAAHDKFLEFAGAPPENFYKYRGAISKAAKTLVDLISSGADEEILNLALADIELEFIKLVQKAPCKKPQLSTFAEHIGNVGQAYAYVLAKRQEMSDHFDLSSYSMGGCGSSIFSTISYERSLNILGISVAPDLVSGGSGHESFFDCPKCRGKISSGLGITTCPHCGYTKDQAAKETGVSC